MSMNSQHRPIGPQRHRQQMAAQHGRLAIGRLVALPLALALAGGGGWWWYQHSQGGAPTASSADAGGGAPGGPGGAGGPGGPGGARRPGGGQGRVQPVSVARVEVRDQRVVLQAIGNMAALNTAVVRAKVDGELKAIRFQEGQTVRAGQVLAELDARSFEAQLAQARGTLARDQAQLRNAQLDLQRYQELLVKDSISRQQVDTQEALVRQLQAAVQIDQAQVDSAALQLSHTKVLAPISGRLGLKLADLGSVVRASDANGLVTITQTQPISLVFAVPETNLAAINGRLKDKQPLQVEVWDRDQRQRLGQGRVVTTDNAIDAATGTIKLKAEFPNADGSLFPNQFVNVRLQLATDTGATTLPSNAIQRGAQGTFVYVVQEDSTVAMRRVRLGVTDGDRVSVQGELAAGDTVVTDGADRLRDGAKVEVIAPRSGGGANGNAAADGGNRRRNAGESPANGPAAGADKPADRSTEKAGDKTGGTSGDKTGDKAGDKANGKPGDKPADNAPAAARPRPADGAAPAGAPGGGAAPAARERGNWGGGGGGGGGREGGERPPSVDSRPPWLDRLPPEEQERFLKLGPDERRAFIEKLRERRRQQRQAEGG